MAIHNDTKTLIGYNSKSYPTMEGAEERFITLELRSIQSALYQIIAVMKLLEARMNSNNLT